MVYVLLKSGSVEINRVRVVVAVEIHQLKVRSAQKRMKWLSGGIRMRVSAFEPIPPDRDNKVRAEASRVSTDA